MAMAMGISASGCTKVPQKYHMESFCYEGSEQAQTGRNTLPKQQEGKVAYAERVKINKAAFEALDDSEKAMDLARKLIKACAEIANGQLTETEIRDFKSDLDEKTVSGQCVGVPTKDNIDLSKLRKRVLNFSTNEFSTNTEPSKVQSKATKECRSLINEKSPNSYKDIVAVETLPSLSLSEGFRSFYCLGVPVKTQDEQGNSVQSNPLFPKSHSSSIPRIKPLSPAKFPLGLSAVSQI